MHRALLVCATLLVPLPALAETLVCRAGPVRHTVALAPGRCSVDGAEVPRMRADPAVCHLSSPQLRILTIAADGAFTYEDTDDDRVFRGTCGPA